MDNGHSSVRGVASCSILLKPRPGIKTGKILQFWCQKLLDYSHISLQSNSNRAPSAVLKEVRPYDAQTVTLGL